jgi:hypothetical protein
MKTTFITSALFAAVAMAGYNVQPFQDVGPSSAKFLQARDDFPETTVSGQQASRMRATRLFS